MPPCCLVMDVSACEKGSKSDACWDGVTPGPVSVHSNRMTGCDAQHLSQPSGVHVDPERNVWSDDVVDFDWLIGDRIRCHKQDTLDDFIEICERSIERECFRLDLTDEDDIIKKGRERFTAANRVADEQGLEAKNSGEEILK